ncbi:uncharacterized protein TNCV_4210841 [Trichonephila clavipes]|nr:uncharacterized protein TNCV_4210841 [Trichonephila clavipes]
MEWHVDNDGARWMLFGALLLLILWCFRTSCLSRFLPVPGALVAASPGIVTSLCWLISSCLVLLHDEAHIWLNDNVNKQNCHIWSEANTQVYVENPLHPENLFGALYGLVESLVHTSSKTMKAKNVTVNGDRYRAMITNFFIPELNNHDVQELWFQQDGATCHTARATIDLLKDTFGDRLISRFGPVNWPPRSCDLTPLDYFCGAM